MPPISQEIQRTTFSRVFLIDGGAGPNNLPQYMSLGRATAVSQGMGDITPIRVPSASQYDSFDVVDTIQGQEDLPTLGVEFRKAYAISAIRKMVKKRCDIDVQVHVGKCKVPNDYDRGYDIVAILEKSRATQYATDDLGAMDGDQNAAVMETVDFTGMQYYEIAPVTASKQADATITDEITRVIIADAITCANCGAPSDGVQVVFGLQAETSGSPGIGGKIIWTKNGGATWTLTNITTGSIGETFSDIVAQGPYLVVASGGAQDRLHYCLISDLLKGVPNWRVVSTGIVAAGSPIRFFKYDNDTIFLTGEGGYLYLLQDVVKGVTVVMSGSVTTNNLRAGHTRNGKDVIVVGDANTILYSGNYGVTFVAVTGPAAAAGIRASAAFCYGPQTYMVGYQNGSAYYTTDGGYTWTAVSIPAVNEIYDIQASTNSVMWIAARDGIGLGNGQILRSINGGYSFVPISETSGTLMPSSRAITTIAATADDPNTIYAGGLATDGNDGVLIRAS